MPGRAAPSLVFCGITAASTRVWTSTRHLCLRLATPIIDGGFELAPPAAQGAR